MSGLVVIGARLIERSIESSCEECNVAVFLPSGHGVDARILCEQCAAKQLEDNEDLEDRLETARDEKESWEEQADKAYAEAADLKEDVRRLEIKSDALIRALACEHQRLVVSVAPRTHYVVERDPDPTNGAFYGKVVSRHTSAALALDAYRKDLDP